MESRPLRPMKESKLTVFIFVRSKYLVKKRYNEVITKNGIRASSNNQVRCLGFYSPRNQ